MSVYTIEAPDVVSTNDAISVAVGKDRLLGISDVAKITNTCPVTASRIIDETGCAIVLHRKKYILESNFLRFLESWGVA